MDILTLDFETFYSPTYSLSKMTTESYVRSEDFEVIGVSVKKNDEPTVWFSGNKNRTSAFLSRYDWDSSVAVAHNAMFDMSILNWHHGIRPKRIVDTLSMARALHGMEQGLSLAALAEYYELGTKGREVLAALGKRRADFTKDELAAYGGYCANDTDLTYKLFQKLADGFPLSELKLIDLTIRMFTEPKLELNPQVLRSHLVRVRRNKQALMESISSSKEDLMSNGKFAELLTRFDVPVPTKISPTTGKEAFAFAKSDEAFIALLGHPDPMVQALVAARLGVKSTLEETRTERFLNISYRGNLPIPLRYYAAHTGRWGGDDKVNMQNLPRNSPLKHAIMAPPGYTLIDSDSSQIEARTLAWLAEQDDLVEAFARGEDVYSIMASSIFAKEIGGVSKVERFIGKTTILGAGYGMGPPKFKAALKTSGMPLDIPLEEAQYIINTYRETYPRIPLLWKQAQRALAAMVADQTAPLGRDGVLQVEGRNGILLPNGLRLKYPNLREELDDKGRVQYVYDVKKGRSTIPTKIYGGKCLGAGTEVLTERGWTPIVGVKTSDRVWDGVEWVNHGGLIYQGEKTTAVIDGVRMTPDHEVLTEEGWRHASSCEGLHRSDFRMPDGSEIRGHEWEAFAVGVQVRLREGSDQSSCGTGKILPSWRDTLLRVCGRGKGENPRHVGPSSVLGLALHARPMPTTFASSVEKLWRSGYSGVSAMGRFFRGVLGGYGFDVQAGVNVRPSRQLGGLYAAELPVGNAGSTSTKHTHHTTSRYKEGGAADGDTTFNSDVSVAPEPVYDLRNAGPRSRFVVRGNAAPFIVHNCVENICQALARIVIGEQMLAINRKLPVVMTVHDAVASIVPSREVETATEYVNMCMKMRPDWGPDLPLNCETGSGLTYGEC